MRVWSYKTGEIEIKTLNVEFDVRAMDLFLNQFCVAVRVVWTDYKRDDVFDWIIETVSDKWFVDKTRKVKTQLGETQEYSNVFFNNEEDAKAFKLRWM